MSTTQARLDAYIAAEEKILAGQSVQFDGDQLTLADLDIVRKEITRLERQLAREKAAARGTDTVKLASFSWD